MLIRRAQTAASAKAEKLNFRKNHFYFGTPSRLRPIIEHEIRTRRQGRILSFDQYTQVRRTRGTRRADPATGEIPTATMFIGLERGNENVIPPEEPKNPQQLEIHRLILRSTETRILLAP